MKRGQDARRVSDRVQSDGYEVVAVTLFGKMEAARYPAMKRAEVRAREPNAGTERSPRGYARYPSGSSETPESRNRPFWTGPVRYASLRGVGSGRKKDSIKIVFVEPVKRRRRRLLLAVALILVCLCGLGYSRLEARQEGTAAVARPSVRPEPLPPDGGRPRNDVPARERGEEEARTDLVSETKETCDDARVLVDRTHELPPDYVPEDLVSLPGNGVPTVGGREMRLRREAAASLRKLVSAATADGEELVVASAFRSYADQRISHGRLKSIYGAGADAMSATPGHSQHQLGTAVDFTNAAVAYQVKRRFGYTSASWWLRHHATEYGFVLSYPPGGDESGYEWEPWHYRYVGVENTERLEGSGLSLQAFLVREGVKPNC